MRPQLPYLSLTYLLLFVEVYNYHEVTFSASFCLPNFRPDRSPGLLIYTCHDGYRSIFGVLQHCIYIPNFAFATRHYFNSVTVYYYGYVG